jgi:hypothetical protein
LQAWSLVTHRRLSKPLPEEYLIWISGLKLGVRNAIDYIDTMVFADEGVWEFADRVLQAFELFQNADRLMCTQEVERYASLYVFKAGVPQAYMPRVIEIMQQLGVRSMSKGKQLAHIIAGLRNGHELLVSSKGSVSTVAPIPERTSTPAGVSQQTTQQGYVRPVRLAFPATHLAVFDEDDPCSMRPDADHTHDINAFY